jgi:hypothetical protein
MLPRGSVDADKRGVTMSNHIFDELINEFEDEKRVVYRNETYHVRDNGAILRELRAPGRKRKLDDFWTFGRPNRATGYMTFSNQVVHRIVATAFHGESPGKQYVVDHIDTNRRNNRVENLRWVTRLDNLLHNPITRRRIEVAYGSLDNFFQDPSNTRGRELSKDFEWMRAVTKEEADASRKRLKGWAESDAKPKGGRLGEWVYKNDAPSENQEEPVTKASLTPGSYQRNWQVPTKFPLCPSAQEGDVLSSYLERLTPGETFTKNAFGTSEVVTAERSNCGAIGVISRFNGDNIKEFAVAYLVREDQIIIHENRGSFFTLEGAAKAYCETLDVPWKEHCERRGLPWGDAIDNYC